MNNIIPEVLLVLFVVNTVHTQTNFQNCERSLLKPLIVTECKISGTGISQADVLPSGTVCLVRCSDKAWTGHGWRKCVNGNWEGSPIKCDGKISVRRKLSRRKRGKQCKGWWWGKKCVYVADGASLSCRGWNWWRKCKAVYPPLQITCPPDQTIFTDYRQTSKDGVTWPLPRYSGGHPIWGRHYYKLSQYSGPRKGTFHAGRYTIKYQVTDSRTSRICSFSIIVKVRKCNYPVRPSNGNVTCEGDNNHVLWGSGCKFTCNNGYILRGSSVVTCTQTGSYNSDSPSCQPKPCGELNETIQYGRYECPLSPHYVDTCELICDKGFVHKGSGPPTCGPDGKWIINQLSCKDIERPKFTNCPKSKIIYADKNEKTAILTWDEIEATDNSGTVSVQQVTGTPKGTRVLSGTYPISFTAKDAAGLEVEDNCHFKIILEVLHCLPPDLQDTLMTYNCEGHLYGNKCDLSCKLDQPLLGDASMTCDKDHSHPKAKTFWNFDQRPWCKATSCSDFLPPLHGASACDKWVGGAICSILCNEQYDAPRGLSNTKNTFVCSYKTGYWNPPMGTVPDCIKKRHSSGIKLPAEVYLYYSGHCGDVKDVISQKFVDKLNHIDSGRYSAFCDDYDDCKAENVEVTCGKTEQKRSLVRRDTGNQIFVTWDFTSNFTLINDSLEASRTFYESKLNTMTDVVKEEINQGEFDELIPGLQTVNNSFNIGYIDFICGEGLKPNYDTGTCRACPTGSKYDKTSDTCLPCPLGTYQQHEASSSDCIECPLGKTTVQIASTHIDNCTEMCEAGKYSKTGVEPCTHCSQGTYQPNINSTDCIKCPVGLLTSSSGATDLSSCTAFALLISDRQWIESTPVSASTAFDEYTILGILKINNIFDIGISIQLNHSDVDYIVNYTVGDNSININGNNMSVTIAEDWIHLLISVNQSGTDIQVFSSSRLISSHTVNITSVIVNGTSLRLTTNADCSLIVRSLRIFRSPIPKDELTKQLETCDITIKDEPILSFDNLDSVQSSDIEITIPSSCDAYDECLSSPCNNHTCINEQGGFTCQCKEGYTGTKCEIPPDYCVNNLCENDASCHTSIITKNYTCNCKSGYKGRLCSYKIVNGGWSDWSEWSQCSVTCNGGNKTRKRTCTKPSPDEDGLNCTGRATELLDCNTEHCPECHEGNLTLGNGVAKAECTGDKDDMICSPICQTGFVFKDIIPSYDCKGGDWLSGNKTEPCTKPVIPKEYKVNLGLSYKIPDCDSQHDVQNQLVQITDQLPCSTNPDCTLNVTINSCVLEPAPTLAMDVFINIPINQSTIDFQPGNGTDDVTRALDTLDRTSQMLQDDDSIFNVVINGVNYTSDMDVVGTIKCPPGTVQANGICVECSPGEYYKEDDDVCEYCALGTYQPDIGQTFCYNCPDGLMTQFIGSDRLSDCLLTKIDDKSTPASYLWIAIVVPVTVVVLAFVVAVLLIVRNNLKSKNLIGVKKEQF